MSSLSHGKHAEPGHYGFTQEQLPPTDQSPLDLAQWFPEDRRTLPMELEIGSGKGTFIITQATKVPDVNFIGLEYARAFWLYASDRVRRRAIENVRLVYTEATWFLRYYVKPASFRQVHIYFPDPWPKARHNKRRLIQAPFLRELHRVLQPGGQIRLATDHGDYFQWMQEHAAQVTELFSRHPFESPEAAGEGELVGTNFERKYRREGRPFHGMVLKRIGE